MVTSRDASGNIFLTMENLAFAMPLILVCGTYAYFKFIPVEYGLPVLGIIGMVFYVRSQIQARRETKLQNLDEDMIQDLAGDEEEDEKTKQAKVKQSKAKAQVERRLASEKRKARKIGKKTNGDEEDEEDALATFAKGSRSKQKKR